MPDGVPALWLERAGGGEPSVVDAVIQERAAGALRVVLDRTRGRAPLSPADDPALVETVLDPTATERARLRAARRLGLDPDDPTTLARALAPLTGRPRILRVRAARVGEEGLPAGRVGVGPAVSVPELPESWAGARTALRFTAEGTAQDPGERVVPRRRPRRARPPRPADRAGGGPPPDVRDLERAAADSPWMLATLHAVATTASLRSAAIGVNVHHSTLQDRLTHAEALLGWPVRTPRGRLRLHLALTLRHLARGGA